MGPLFSIVFMAVIALLVLGAAFGVARIFHPPLLAFPLAVAFVLGGGAGSVIFLVLSWLAIGEITLTSHWQVLAYFAALAASAVSGGFCFFWSARRSDIFKRMRE